jgi:hypothetical protein
MTFNGPPNHGFERARMSEQETNRTQAAARAELHSRLAGEGSEQASPGPLGRLARRVRAVFGDQGTEHQRD